MVGNIFLIILSSIGKYPKASTGIVASAVLIDGAAFDGDRIEQVWGRICTASQNLYEIHTEHPQTDPTVRFLVRTFVGLRAGYQLLEGLRNGRNTISFI